VKRIWMCILGITILSHAMGWAQQTGSVFTDTLAFENGRIADNVYSNECFGFSFVIPDGWQLTTQVADAHIRATHTSRVSLTLLTIDQHQQGSFKSTIALNAHDAVYSPTVQQFVSDAVHGQVNVDQKNRGMIKDAYPVDYGTRHFFRADYRQTTSAGARYFAFVFTRFRGYYIGETIMAESPEQLGTAASSVQQLSFRDDKPNLKCVMSGNDDFNSEGNGSEVRSSGPTLYRGLTVSDPPPVLVSQGVATNLLTRSVPPAFPEIALKHRVQGQVVLRALVATNGDVEEVTPVSGDPMLVPVTLEAVKQWKYRPYLLNGKPVKFETQITVVFQLNGP
jgi:TonB family protein